MAKAIKMTAIAFLKTDPALLFEMIYRGAKVEIIYPRGAIISKHEVFAEKVLKCIYDNVECIENIMNSIGIINTLDAYSGSRHMIHSLLIKVILNMSQDKYITW